MNEQRPIDTTNKFLIGRQGNGFVFLRQIPPRLSHDDAMLLAAYIVAMCSDRERWKAVLQAVCNS